MTAGIKSFREAYVSAPSIDADDFNSFAARRVRYEVNWAAYENTLYRKLLHSYSQAYLNQYGLGKYTRSLLSPVYRAVEFYKATIYGGALSRNASNDGAIPIDTANDPLRPAIAKLWLDSNMQALKDILPMWGAALGDVGIKIFDDETRGLVRLELVHPSTIADLELEGGIVKGYCLQEERYEESSGKEMTYTETCERGEGETVIFKTYAGSKGTGGKPYAWDGHEAEWIMPFGFVPFVAIQHNNVGLDWGWAEMHAARSRCNEVDDIASMVDDQIRKSVNVFSLFSGVKKSEISPSAITSDATADKPEPGREEMKALCVGDANAKWTPMVFPVDIVAASAQIDKIMAGLEKDYPEIRDDIFEANARVVGVVLSRQKVERKVIQRRQNYDAGLVRAQQMAIAISGWRGYKGYEGFDLTSYRAGKLDHAIADRPVFAVDTTSLLTAKKLEWETVNAAVLAGVPIESALRDVLGWGDEQIQKFNMARVAEQDYNQTDFIPTVKQ